MKILIAPDSFKGSLTALEVAEYIEKGVLSAFPEAETIKVPMADGGEGTVHSLISATGGKILTKKVTGPLGNKVEAYFGILGNKKTGVIEMATASGLPLVPPEKANPAKTTTFGTGELIKAALDYGVEELIIGIGGSATNDAGVGMAQALGVKFLDSKGKEIGFGGEEIIKINKIDMSGIDSRINNIKIYVACDVKNPFYGPDGAAFVYAPQKGATPEIVKMLDNNLRHIAKLMEEQLGKEIQSIPGSGAAGGLGGGLVAFLNAELKAGIKLVLEASKLSEKLEGVDLVITGEGRIDAQTIYGKTPIGVAKCAKEFGIPVIALAGSLGADADVVLKEGIDAIFCIAQTPVELKKAIENSKVWLQKTSRQIMEIIKIGGNIIT